MSQQTATFRVIIDNAKGGNEAALKMCRTILKGIADGEDTPLDCLMDMCEIALMHGIEQGRRDAEAN